jgi:hypothetical protein
MSVGECDLHLGDSFGGFVGKVMNRCEAAVEVLSIVLNLNPEGF